MNTGEIVDVQKDAALFNYLVCSTVPLLSDGPTVLGTGTLFTHEDRHFIVTAAHVLKVDHEDPESEDIDLAGIAVPDGRKHAAIFTLGSFNVHRPAPPSRVDVAVLELLDPQSIATLKKGWRFLDFDVAGAAPTEARFILAGFPKAGATWDGKNVGQNFLMLSTDKLPRIPNLQALDLSVDRFFHLEKEGELLDGSRHKIPELHGMSGASVWAYTEPSGIWAPPAALKVVAVQCSYSPARWFRCVDWAAVRYILNRPELGFTLPPNSSEKNISGHL